VGGSCGRRSHVKPHRTAAHAVYKRFGSSWVRGSELLTAISDFNAAAAVVHSAQFNT